MFISVVIPLFNKKEYVLRAIRSVLNQTHSDFELIVVDDGSTDGSADVVKLISDPRVRLIRQANGGVSRARNAGVRIAQAKWVAFLDADDEYKADFLAQVAAFIQAHEGDNLSVVGSNYHIGRPSRLAVSEAIKSGVYDYFVLFRDHRSPSNSSTTVVNKKKFLEVGGFPEGVVRQEDWIAWFKLAFVGNFGFISAPLGVYHVVEDSASRVKRPDEDFFNDAMLLPQVVSDFAKKYPLSAERERVVGFCMNEYALNAARLLAHDGAKKLAFKMLRLLHVKYFSIKRMGRIPYLIRHLITPQWVKQMYWARKVKRAAGCATARFPSEY
jgi:glycosyltransferase involved in cell wall biosynthesis